MNSTGPGRDASSPSAVGSSPVQRTTLPNGLRIITETMPHVRSVAVGVWVNRGSRHELEAENGITHFTEHMVFKGTDTRSAEDIACAVDAIGGHLDAYTTKESVAFTVKVLDEHLPIALDVISDMVLRPAFREEDVAKEKGVVLEELKMDEDNPDYLIHEIFSETFWKGYPLGRPIIGTRRSICGFDRSQLQQFFARTFHPKNLLVTAAGRLEHERLVALVEERFGPLGGGGDPVDNGAPQPNPEIVLRDKPALEQVHLCLGVGAFRMADPRRFVGYVMSTLLGGGVSSRLFLKVREHAGLAYSVFSDLSLYSDAGCLSVYAGTSLDSTPEVIGYILREFRDLKENLVADEELRRAKDHLKGSLMLSLESTSSRMSNLARQERYFGRTVSLDEVLERIEGVTAAEVREMAGEWFHPDRIAVAVLGDLKGFQLGRADLAC